MNEIDYHNKFVEVVDLWKNKFAEATAGKKLTNTLLADSVRLSREHFQRLIGPDYFIDVVQYENLLGRYFLWHGATVMGLDPVKALQIINIEEGLQIIEENYAQYLIGPYEDVWQKEKPGSTEPDLLTQIKIHADSIISLTVLMKEHEGAFQPGINVAPGARVQRANTLDRKKTDKKLKDK